MENCGRTKMAAKGDLACRIEGALYHLLVGSKIDRMKLYRSN